MVFLASLFVIPSGADAEGSSESVKIIDESIKQSWYNRGPGLEYSLATGEEAPFDYTVPDGGVTVIVFFNGSGSNANSNNFFDELTESSWAVNPKINLVAIDALQNSRESVQQFLRDHDKNGVVKNVYYSPTNIMLPYWYITLINKDGQMEGVRQIEGSYGAVYVLIITEENGNKYIRYHFSSERSVEYFHNYLNEFVDTGEQTVPLISVSPIGVLHYEYVDPVIDLVNEFRVSSGVSELTTNADLTSLAMFRAIETSVVFEHTRPNGQSGLSVTLDGVTYSGILKAENIAAGQKTPEEVIESWINSPAHCKNLISNKMDQIGVGAFETNGVMYWVQLFGSGTEVTSNDVDTDIPNVCMPVETYADHVQPYFEPDALDSFVKTADAGDRVHASIPVFYSVNSDEGTSVLRPTVFLPLMKNEGDDGNPFVYLASTKKDSPANGFSMVTDIVLYSPLDASGTVTFTPYEGCELTLQTTLTIVYGEDGIMGDVNQDLQLNSRDVTMLMKSLLTGITAEELPVGDMNRDGRLNLRDVAALMKNLLIVMP